LNYAVVELLGKHEANISSFKNKDMEMAIYFMRKNVHIYLVKKLYCKLLWVANAGLCST